MNTCSEIYDSHYDLWCLSWQQRRWWSQWRQCIFIQANSIAPIHVHYYSEALHIQHGYCVGISHRSATGNCERRTCARSVYVAARAGFEHATLRTKSRRIYQWATTFPTMWRQTLNYSRRVCHHPTFLLRTTHLSQRSLGVPITSQSGSKIFYTTKTAQPMTTPPIRYMAQITRRRFSCFLASLVGNYNISLRKTQIDTTHERSY